jgi:hypothetical protein
LYAIDNVFHVNFFSFAKIIIMIDEIVLKV